MGMNISQTLNKNLKMKNFVLKLIMGIFSYVVCATMCSCNDLVDSLNGPQGENTTLLPGVKLAYVENGKISTPSRSETSRGHLALSFDSETEVKQFKSYLNSLPQEQALETVQNLGVTPFMTIEQAADLELDSIGNAANSEMHFHMLYFTYLQKYKDKLIQNNLDSTDLSLYLGVKSMVDALISNEDGVYVVNNEVCSTKGVTLPECVVAISAIPEGDYVPNIRGGGEGTGPDYQNNYGGDAIGYSIADGIPSFLNEYIYKPQSDKKVYFAIRRNYDTVKVFMKVRKKMWYGWKNDPHRHFIFEPYLQGLNFSNPRFARYWSDSRKGVDAILGTAPGLVEGEIYTWTDMTACHDENGNLIIEPFGHHYAPRCKYEQAIHVRVALPRVMK